MSNISVLLTRKQVAERLGISIETIKQHRRSGEMPEPDYIIDNKPLWREKTIDKWNENRRKWAR